MAAMDAASVEIEEQLGVLRKPQFNFFLAELDGLVVDRNMLGGQANLGNGADEIGLDADDLESICVDPRASAKPDREDVLADGVSAHARGLVFALLEVHLPYRAIVPVRQPFAGHVVL